MELLGFRPDSIKSGCLAKIFHFRLLDLSMIDLVLVGNQCLIDPDVKKNDPM